MWFRRKPRKPLPPPEVDHTLADAAIREAVHAHAAAQEQASEAQKVVAELRQVNIRNGFAPAIRKSFDRPIGGAL